MPHERKRHIHGFLQKALSHSPLVGVLGHRQVGKTTLLMQEASAYTTFDDAQTLSRARLSPKDFLTENATKLTAIDECQMAPEIFPALKEWVRLNKRPGQFVLSGSVRFTSRSAIKESLTGRILNLDLFPFGVAELMNKPLPQSLLDLAQKQSLEKLGALPPLSALVFKQRQKTLDTYLHAGGLPGVCFVREDKMRKLRIEEQLYTILDRDLRSVYPTKLPYQEILAFLRALAKAEGKPVQHAALKRETGISPATQKHLLFALEAVFILRTHPIDGERKTWTYLFEDQAEWRWLAEGSEMNANELQKRAWIGAVYRNVRLQFGYRMGENSFLSSFQTRSGVQMPLVLHTQSLAGRASLGIFPLFEENISHQQLLWAQSFLKRHSNSSVVFLAKPAKKARLVQERIALAPACWALFE